MKNIICILYSILISSIVCAQSSTIVDKTKLDSGIVACYSFNDNTKDYSGNNNNGSAENIAFIPDRLGKASSAIGFRYYNNLDGSIRIPQSPSLQSLCTNSFTVSGWIYISDWYDSGPHGQWFSIINKTMASDIHEGWAIQVKSVGMIEFTKNGNAARFNYPFELKKWYHIVYVYSDNESTAQFYINGQDLGTEPYYIDLSDVDGDLYFGSNPYGDEEWDSGAIDDFRFYNRELTVDEIKKINDTTTVKITSKNATITKNKIICIGNIDTLSSTITGGIWLSSNDKIASISNSGIVSAISTGQVVINYYLPNTCNNSVSITLNVSKKPSIQLPKDSLYCNTINVPINLTDLSASFTWQDNTTSNYYTITEPGIYSVTATNNCGSVVDSVKISRVSSPLIKLPTDILLCNSKPLLVNVSLPGTNKYLWQDKSSNPQYTLTKGGMYSVTVTDSNNCKTSKSIIVKELATPSFPFPNDTIACNEILLPINVNCDECNYLWNDGSVLSKNTIQNEGEYRVTVSNNCGTVSKGVHVRIIDCISYLDVPNAFSPNSDGLNDVLFALGRNIENISFIIYDRWGQKVFVSNNLTDGWDGTFKGRTLESATFMYSISATGINDGKSIIKMGNIALIQ